MKRIVVVGGSTGAVRSVQALRRAGYDGELVLVSDESCLPYDRPPLSKEMLGAEADEPVPLLTSAEVDDLDLTLRLGHRATALDPFARVLSLQGPDGPDALTFDRLVIATGVTARELSGTEYVDGVHVIRDLDDATAVRAAMGPDRRAVVVGAGFIGAEFAAAARARQMHVTIVEAQDVPLSHVLGAEVGGEVAAIHAENGACLLTGRTVAEVHLRDGRAAGVRLDDGQELPADVVVVGIGATPATAWLEGSGLPISDGVECDGDLEVVGFPGIYAVGDIARWPHPSYAEPIRVEHWTNAGDHAQVMAAHVMGRDRPTVPLPYVWSDQYGHRIQIIGRPSAGRAVSLRGTVASRDLVALYADDAGLLVGGVVVDDPRLLMRLRKAIAAGTPAAEIEHALTPTAS